MQPMGSICANMTQNNQQPHANLNLPYARVLSANKTNTKGTKAWWYSIMQWDFSSVDKASHSSHSLGERLSSSGGISKRTCR